jgi:hypothetical protein
MNPHLLAVVAALVTSLSAQERPRSAAAILRDFHAVAMPSMSSGGDAESVARFKQAIADGCRRQGELAQELFEHYPDHEQVPHVLDLRWAGMTNALQQADAAFAETDTLRARDDLRPELRRQVLQARARAALQSKEVAVPGKLAAIRDAIAFDKGDERSGLLLLEFAEQHVGNPESMRRLADLALANWPDSTWVARPASAMRKQLDKVGKPLELAFDDVLGSGKVEVRATGKPFVLVQVWSGDPKFQRGHFEQLQQLRQRLGAGALAMVGVYNGKHDGGAAGVRAMLRGAGIDWPHSYDEGQVQTPWQGPFAVPRTPFYYLLDGNGVVVGVAYTVAAVEQRLAELRAK